MLLTGLVLNALFALLAATAAAQSTNVISIDVANVASHGIQINFVPNPNPSSIPIFNFTLVPAFYTSIANAISTESCAIASLTTTWPPGNRAANIGSALAPPLYATYTVLGPCCGQHPSQSTALVLVTRCAADLYENNATEGCCAMYSLDGAWKENLQLSRTGPAYQSTVICPYLGTS